MSRKELLSDCERSQLFDDNLIMVKYSIGKHVHGVGSNAFMTYDDLYQTGCIALEKATHFYDGSIPFGAYACFCIRYALIDYLRKYANKPDDENHPLSLDCEVSINLEIPGCLKDTVVDKKAEFFRDDIECEDLLARLAMQYTGVTRKGILILYLRYRGFSDRDISCRYGLKTNNMRAWVARARKKLETNQDLQVFIKDITPELRDIAC